MANEAIANLTHHQNITDAMMTSMGECMALQQALMHVPNFDGKNIPLKSFIQDVENGYTFVPEGLREGFFKGVISKLKETARDAVTDKTIDSIESLSSALREYFAPRKSYPYYCAEIQAIRLRRDETVLEYYTRIKRLRSSAIAAIRDKFTEQQKDQMVPMLDGLALESFKRGLSDDFAYAVSVQDPETIEDAFKIVQRVERDMAGASARNSNSLRYTQIEKNPEYNRYPEPRRVSFDQTNYRSDRNANPMYNKDTRFLNFLPRQQMQTQRPQMSRQRNFNHQNFQPRMNPQNHRYQNYSPNPNFSPFPYYPQVPPWYYNPFPPQPQPYYPQYPNHFPNYGKSPQLESVTNRGPSPRPSDHLNYPPTRRTDVPTGEGKTERPSKVNFLTAENLLDVHKGEGKRPQ